MYLDKLLGVLNLDILFGYLHGLRGLLIVIEHVMHISIGDACLADSLMADHDDLPVEVGALNAALRPTIHRLCNVHLFHKQ